MNEETVLETLKAIAFSDFTEYIWIEDGAVRIRDSRDLSPAQRSAIAGIKDSGKGVEIKLHDKQKALELLAKYLGLFDRAESPEDRAIRVELNGLEDWAE